MEKDDIITAWRCRCAGCGWRGDGPEEAEPFEGLCDLCYARMLARGEYDQKSASILLVKNHALGQIYLKYADDMERRAKSLMRRWVALLSLEAVEALEPKAYARTLGSLRFRWGLSRIALVNKFVELADWHILMAFEEFLKGDDELSKLKAAYWDEAKGVVDEMSRALEGYHGVFYLHCMVEDCHGEEILFHLAKRIPAGCYDEVLCFAHPEDTVDYPYQELREILGLAILERASAGVMD